MEDYKRGLYDGLDVVNKYLDVEKKKMIARPYGIKPLAKEELNEVQAKVYILEDVAQEIWRKANE